MVDGTRSYGDNPPHGSIGEEATKLVEAVQGWLGGRTGRAPDEVWSAATASAGSEPGSEAFHSPECRVCPLCRAMRFVTTVNPQVLENLTDAATSLSAALRAMAEDAGRARWPADPADTGVDRDASHPAGDGEA